MPARSTTKPGWGGVVDFGTTLEVLLYEGLTFSMIGGQTRYSSLRNTDNLRSSLPGLR